jgi:hypothetical protein
MKNLSVGLFSAAFVLTALIMTLIAVAQWLKVAKARRWPVAVGRVLESRVVESRDNDNHSYSPVIRYEYAVGQTVYTGNRLSFGNMGASEAWAEKIVAKYPSGSDVQVHYDPGEPTNALLEVRAATATLLLCIGTAFLVVGVVVAGVFIE